MFDGENIDDKVWQGMVDTINEKLKELNIEPIKIDFNTGGIKKGKRRNEEGKGC